MWFIIRKIAFSLPGMMRELSTTVSPGFKVKMLVVIDGHARQRRHRLALRAGNDNGDLVRRHLHDVLRTQQGRVGNREQAEIVRDLGHVQHAAAEKRDFAPVLGGEIQNLLQAMNGTAEAGNDEAPFRSAEQFFQARPDRALAFRVAGPVDVRGIGQQQQHAAFAVFGEGMQVEELVIGRRGIDFEVAGMNDDARAAW